MYRKFSRGTEENIHSELSEINWNPALINCGDNVDAAFSKLFYSLNKVINEHAPLRRYLNAKPNNSKPWITEGLLKSIKIKNLFAFGNNDKYILYRNKIITLTRCS